MIFQELSENPANCGGAARTGYASLPAAGAAWSWRPDSGAMRQSPPPGGLATGLSAPRTPLAITGGYSNLRIIYWYRCVKHCLRPLFYFTDFAPTCQKQKTGL